LAISRPIVAIAMAIPAVVHCGNDPQDFHTAPPEALPPALKLLGRDDVNSLTPYQNFFLLEAFLKCFSVRGPPRAIFLVRHDFDNNDVVLVSFPTAVPHAFGRGPRIRGKAAKFLRQFTLDLPH
jgi:hypothetical protein